MMYCPDCGFDLDSTPTSAPCPGCGRRRRSASVEAQVADAQVQASSLTVRVEHTRPRPWETKWQDVLSALDRIRGMADGSHRVASNREGERATEQFFEDCYALAEWIEGDTRATPKVAGGEAVRFRESDPHLQLCADICNSIKHHTRRPNRPHGGILATTMGESSIRFTIEVERRSGSTMWVDALDLAEDCVEAWRSFLRDQGMIP